jgi:transcriptional accessory protein Tex/SPT6
MVLEGVVTNVANFGAFVDIGVHQDGLVHISALATLRQGPARRGQGRATS